MTLMEAINQIAQEQQKCKFGAWLEKQNQPFKAELSQAIARTNLHTTFKALNKIGMPASQTTFYNHQKGKCKCI